MNIRNHPVADSLSARNSGWSTTPATSLATLLLAVFLPLLAVSCASTITAPTIGPEGGELSLPGISLSIPAGALDREVAITIERADDEVVGPFTVLPGSVVRLSPSGLTFLTPVTLTISFDPSDLPTDIDLVPLAIHRLNEDGSSTALPSLVDMEAGTISAELTSFSFYFTPIFPLLVKTWVGGDGAGPQDWHNESNWSPAGVPLTAGQSVRIPSTATIFPRVTKAASAYILTVEEGAQVQLAGAGIGVWGDLVVDGVITSEGTNWVLLQGDDTQRVRGTLPNLWVGHTATLLSGATVVTGDVLVEGTDASFEIGEHRLEIGGDLLVNSFPTTRGRLLMEHAAGTVIVRGDATFRASWGGAPTLQRGTLEVHGQLRQQGVPDALRAGMLHTVRFAGSGNRQSVSFEHPHAPDAGLGFVSIANPGGVALLSDVRAHSLSFADAGVGAQLVQRDGLEVVLDIETSLLVRGHVDVAEVRVGGNLAAVQGYDYFVQRTVFTGRDTSLPHQEMTMLAYRDVIVDGGQVRVADPFVRVLGDLVLRDGRLRVPEGRVFTVVGDLSTEGTGVLRMESGDRIVLLGGAFFTAPGQELLGGTLWVRGDFDADPGAFVTADERHTTVFFGSAAQELRGSPVFGTAAVVNTGVGLTISSVAPFGFQQGAGRLLDLVGNTRVAEERVVSVTNIVYRSSSQTHFEDWAYFNCDTIWTESGFAITYDGSTFGCWRGTRTVGAARDKPPLGDYTPPAFVQSVIEAPANESTFEVGDTVAFSGYAMEGFSIVEASYAWFSSRDGLLGTSASFSRDDLSEGLHVIELRTDTDDGAPSYAFSVIRIGDPPPDPPELASIVVSPSEADVALRGSRSFAAQMFDQYGQVFFGADISWSVTNPCVASISESGFLRSIGVPGLVTVRATSGDISGSASASVLTDTGTPPANVRGSWVVCDRSTGKVVLYLDLDQVEGSTAVTGQVTNADNGQTASLFPPQNLWQDDTLNLRWSWLVQGGEREFGIQNAVGFDTNALRGQYNDRFLVQVYDVDIVRLDTP